MGLFNRCNHDFEVTGEKFIPADTEIDYPSMSMLHLVWPGRRKKTVWRSYTEIAFKCAKCGETETVDKAGYKPPSHEK